MIVNWSVFVGPISYIGPEIHDQRFRTASEEDVNRKTEVEQVVST